MMVHKFLDKNSALLARSETIATRDKSTSGGAAKNEKLSNQKLSLRS